MLGLGKVRARPTERHGTVSNAKFRNRMEPNGKANSKRQVSEPTGNEQKG